MPALRCRPFHVFLLAFILVTAAMTTRAELVLRLGSTQAVPGTAIELEGLLINDTGSLLSAPITHELRGQWTDTQGRTTPVSFQLRTSANTANLPVNAFTRMIWVGSVPDHAQGLLRLTIQGADNTLLALQVSEAERPLPINHALLAQPATPTHQMPPAPQADTGLSPFETFRNALSPYEPIYFALGNRGGANARFQLSFKYRPFSPADPAHPGFMDHWYIGYTQTSLWDLHSDSIPFVDTTYNPSLFWAREALWETTDQRWALGLNTGIEHKSNGKDGQESRSLNNAYLQPEISYRLDDGSRLSFMPRIKTYVGTDSDMDYPAYLGYIDWKLRWAQDNGMTLSGLYRQGSRGHATQIEATWPLQQTALRMNGHLYAQYFQGYGETLLGYREKSSPQFRIGIALVP